MTNSEPILTIGVTSKALFDLRKETALYDKEGLAAYRKYQVKNENKLLKPGAAFGLVKTLLELRDPVSGINLARVNVISQNDHAACMRVLNSIESHKLDVTSAAFTGGSDQVPYINAYKCDLYLSSNQGDVFRALSKGFAAASIYVGSGAFSTHATQIRVAFDGDCVLFDATSEIYYRKHKAKWLKYEEDRMAIPLGAGPFKKFLAKLCRIQNLFPDKNNPIRTAMVTARSVNAHKRPINTLRHWGIRVDEYYFLGGMDKAGVLEAFQPHIFFDDREEYCISASTKVPTARVPTNY